jgi:hypothetical protein
MKRTRSSAIIFFFSAARMVAAENDCFRYTDPLIQSSQQMRFRLDFMCCRLLSGAAHLFSSPYPDAHARTPHYKYRHGSIYAISCSVLGMFPFPNAVSTECCEAATAFLTEGQKPQPIFSPDLLDNICLEPGCADGLFDILSPLSEQGAKAVRAICPQSSMGTLCEHGQGTLPPEESDDDGSPVVSLCHDVASENVCDVYPEDGPCAAFGYRGMPVFIPAGSCAAELFASITKYVKTASIASERCYPFMMQFVCSQIFFPCEYMGNVPVPSLFCLRMCNSFFEHCAFELKSVSYTNNCDGVTVGGDSSVGGDSYEAINFYVFEMNKQSTSGYEGELYFPANRATFHGNPNPNPNPNPYPHPYPNPSPNPNPP